MEVYSGAVDLAVMHLKQRSTLDVYKNDPVKWAKDILGIHLWSKQEEICRSVIENKRTVVRSSNGIGKTATCGVLAAWWIATQYADDPDDTVVVITAPSFQQIRMNMFSEVSKDVTRSQSDKYPNGKNKPKKFQQPLPGKVTTAGNVAEWKDGNNIFAIGRKPAEGQIVTTFQGIHRKNVLFIIDEAGGMPPEMFVAAEAMTTNRNAKILAVGNPDRRGSEFYKLFYGAPKDIWHQIHVSSYDTPAFTGESCPAELLDYMPTPEWVEQNIKAWGGMDDPRTKIRILGEFPDSDDTVFFPESTINRADDTDIPEGSGDVRIMGVDLAMHGVDESRAYLNDGGRIRLLKAWPGGTATNNAEMILSLAEQYRPDFINIDSGGIGIPIIERVFELAADCEYTDFVITAMNGSETSPDVRQWYNNRAYWYDLLRRRINLGEVDLEITNDLRKQMTDINYDIRETGNRAGSVLMESKKDMRKRVGYSPDDVDAIVYANMNPLTDLATGPAKKTKYETPEELIGDYYEMPGYLLAIEGLW